MTLTRPQSAAMRGLAILGIILHNFTHWLGPMVKENEYTYSQHNVDRLLVELAHPSWELPLHLLSFFGHYGVPVFVALSAYGLVMKYEAPTTPRTGGASFLASHFRKLFTMMIVGYAAFVLVDYMTPHPRHYELWNVVGQLGMFSNLYADPDHAIWPGPYWYFGLMLQLYAVYRLCLYRRQLSIKHYALCIVLFALPYCFAPEGALLNWWRYNCLGHLPLFILALWLARREAPPSTHPNYALCIVNCALTLFFSLSFYTWPLAAFAAAAAVYFLVKALPERALPPLVWLGNLSAAIFVCHPITRKILIPIAHRGDPYAALLLYIITTLLLAMLFRRAIAALSIKH